VKVLIPTQLRDYTHQESEVQAAGATLNAVLNDLDARYPGIRFRIVDEQDRIRPHVRVFINKDQACKLSEPVAETDRVLIFGALSGG
jgi:molybdopterin converting factor small subunit